MADKKNLVAFMRRTLERCYARGLTARDLFFQEYAQEGVDSLYADRVFMERYAEGTYAEAAEGYGEILTEREFVEGLEEDYYAHLKQYGPFRPSRDEKRRASLYLCFIGAQTYAHEREGR